ncbi:MAG: rRNA maturation RNase YbeY [Patescibacteria group bacterium]
MLNLDIYNHTKSKLNKNFFLKLIPRTETVLAKEKVIKKSETHSIELTLVSKKEITELNKKYRGKNKPTDVISISFFDKKTGDNFAGEIFICLEFAKWQAKEMGHSLQAELMFLFIHGLLHLFGYDHQKPAASKLMERLTDKMMV